jgi:hypothetical protein
MLQLFPESSASALLSFPPVFLPQSFYECEKSFSFNTCPALALRSLLPFARWGLPLSSLVSKFHQIVAQ